jgi:hypothetical protein
MKRAERVYLAWCKKICLETQNATDDSDKALKSKADLAAQDATDDSAKRKADDLSAVDHVATPKRKRAKAKKKAKDVSAAAAAVGGGDGTDDESFVGKHPRDDRMTNDWMIFQKIVETASNPQGPIPSEGAWDPFYGDGKSEELLAAAGIKARHEKKCFFKEVKKPNTDTVIITSPPFKKMKEICTALKNDWGKPFIIDGPPWMMNAKWFNELFEYDLQYIIPKTRPTFTYLSTGNKKCTPRFGTIYYAYPQAAV